MTIADKIYTRFVEQLPSLEGKCIVITGTTSGTGNEAALVAAEKGAAAVLLLNRKSERADSADAKLALASPNTKFISVVCDLSSLASTKEAAAAVKGHAGAFGGVDVLCCNAAIAQMPDSRTADGFDVQMQTNHLSHALLVEELMPCLEAAAAARSEARVVFHASGARFFPFTKVEDFGGKHFTKCEPGTLGGDCTTMQLLSMKSAHSVRYNHSKLAMTTYAMALHEKLAAQGSKVKVVCCEPGSAETSLISKGFMISEGVPANATLVWMANKVAAWTSMAQSARDGACPLMAAAFGADAQSGDMFAPMSKASGMPVYVTGWPTKVIAANKPVPDAKLSEENTLNTEYQIASWDATRRALGLP